MATVHSWSVLTNSCVKSPINPSNGLASTLDERPAPTLDMTWAGRDADFKDHEIKKIRNTVSTKAVKFHKTLTAPAGATRTNTPAKKTRQTVADRLTHELSDLSDDQFYAKLRQLQHEHKKTVEASESLYNEKVAALHTAAADLECSYVAGLDDLSRSEDYTVHARKYFPSEPHSSTEFNNGASPIFNYAKSHGTATDMVRDMSASKPPSGRLSKSLDFGAECHRPEQSRHERWSDDTKGYFWRTGRHNSTDTETVSDGSDGERSPEEEDYMSIRSCDETKSYAMAHIKKMWDNFSIDDYMPTEPQPKRRRSNSMSRLTTGRNKNNNMSNNRSVDNWRHRVTIPKPFKMEQRRLKKEPLKTRAMREVEREHQLRKEQEEAECLRKFKAKPVPAHVYMPLYNEIMEDKETKSRNQREYVKELLKSTEKPFQFMKREEQKKKERILQMWMTRCEDDEAKKQFKANPFPEHIFEESITDKIKEEELYRKIRIQMRAEELLQSSTLPPNMSARSCNGKYRSKTFNDIKRKSCLSTEPKFRPTINEVVPDFEELHRQFLREMGQRKMAREATVCKPFNLRTQQSRHTHKIYDDIAKDETKMKEKKWKFSRNGHTSNCSKSFTSHLLGGSLSSLDSFPAKMTTAAQLRAGVSKRKAERDSEQVRREREAEHERRQKERRLKKVISSRVSTCEPNVSSRRTLKLKEYRETQQQRAENYKQELEEMRRRVDGRPLLFEQTSQINAKLAAEKKYKDALKHMGIDERLVTRKGSASATDVAVTCHSDDDDDIPVYSHHSDTYRSQHSNSERRVTTENYATDASYQRSRSRNPSSTHSYTRSRSRSYERTADDASDGQIEEDIQYDEVYD